MTDGCEVNTQTGTCANILAGTDPASECPGAQNCNGSGCASELTIARRSARR
jgi:hypothetical protein